MLIPRCVPEAMTQPLSGPRFSGEGREPMLHASKLVLFLLLALALALPATANEASPYGINVHAPQGAELTAILDQVQAAGIGWVRIDFVWAFVEPARGAYDWSLYDAIAAAAHARGIEIYATLAYTPRWATSGPELTGVPADPGDWANFCFLAAQRYRNSIRYWGLWNEPNLDHFWAGTRQQYLDFILKPGADAIHAANPAAKVGGPDLAHLTASHEVWFDWLRDTLEQAGDRLDFVTHHIYDNDGNGDVTDKLEDSTLFGDRPSFWGTAPPSVKEVLRYTGWLGRPFWLTETGWESARVSEARQASYYDGMLADWFGGRTGRDWVAKVFFYEMKDGAAAGSPTWGIVRPDGSPKPAYDAYRAFIARRQSQSDDAQLVAATVPDRVEAGQPLTVRLTFKNAGGTTWTAAAGYKLGAVGDQDPFAAPRQPLGAADRIAPGQQKTFAVPMTAPASPGTYHTDWRMLREGVSWFGAAFAKDVTVLPAPAPEARTLSLFSGRFGVEVSWQDHGGGAGFGRAVPGSAQSGFFWFFDPANTELVVKVLDGRSLNGKFWVFYGALSDVEYQITVTDRTTGAVRQYHNASGNVCGGADTSAFTPTGALAAAAMAGGSAAPGSGPGVDLVPLSGGAFAPSAVSSCAAGPLDLCLFGSRFRVDVEWRDHAGNHGTGAAVPRTDQTGTFWFFDPANTELVVKVLDGRALTGKFWVFYGALSDVEYWITVTDTTTGASKRYHNVSGNICGVADTQAL
jgi:glycosyl hydrolase family 39 (putative alpha-L-iduronidase)/Ig-like domain-containing protein